MKIGAYVIGGITDHITPWKSCYGTARLFGEKSTFVLANAGPPAEPDQSARSPEVVLLLGAPRARGRFEWAKAAQPTRQDGSWWPHWRAWMQQRSGELVAAPKQAGSRKHRPLCAGTW